MKNNSIKKILVVAESIDVEDSSGTKGRVALIKNLHKAGFELLVYHYTRKEIHLENIPCKAIKENRSSLLFFLSRGERLLRHKLNLDLHRFLENVFGFSFTLFNDRNSIVVSLNNIKDFEADLVLTLSKGGSYRPHHALLKIPKWHHKWLAYMHDPYPMHLYPRPYAWVEPGHMQKYRFIKKMIEKAAFTSFPSKFLMEWMASYFPKCEVKGVIIPHQISKINHKTGGNFPHYFTSGNFKILHAGNLLWGRDPNGLIRGFKLFLRNNPEAKGKSKLIFLGGKNHYSEDLDRESKSNDGIYVSDTYVPHLEVLAMQKEADVNVILETKSEISPFLPGKFPHCVDANRPILLLGPYYSESKRLLGKDYDYWAEVDQEEKISKLLEILFKEWLINSTAPKLNRPDLEYYLSLDYLKNTMDNLFKRV